MFSSFFQPEKSTKKKSRWKRAKRYIWKKLGKFNFFFLLEGNNIVSQCLRIPSQILYRYLVYNNIIMEL